MIVLMEGEEKYLKMKAIHKEKEKLEDMELCFREYWEWSPNILDYIESAPFLGERKICVLYFMPEVADFLSADIWDGTEIYIIPKKMPDTQKAVVKEILERCQKKQFEKVSKELLNKSVRKRLESHGIPGQEIDKYQDQLERAFAPYYTEREYDLFSVIQRVDMMGFSGNLNEQVIQEYGLEGMNLKAYKLATMILDQRKESMLYARDLLKEGEAPIGILSLVQYQVRICWKVSLDKGDLNKIGIKQYQLYPAYDRYLGMTYRQLYDVLQDGISRIKNGERAEVVVILIIENCLKLLKRQIKKNVQESS